jgi:hypothetical protein
MKILKYELMPEEELLARLRKTPLRGFDNVEVYKHAKLALRCMVSVDSLTPPQRYVLTPGVQTILDLADTFAPMGIDVFGLEGALLFWTEGMDPEKDVPIPLLPPIVEVSHERDGVVVNLVNDGMHRVYAARKRGRRINIVRIENVPIEYPYYAYAMLEGWGAVQEFEELPDEFQKKDYRNPNNYKALFRQFNKIFPGVQEARKQSNPTHIKA